MTKLQDISTNALPNDIGKRIESMQQQLNEWARLISNEDRTKITKDDAGDERLLVGYQQGGFSNGNVGIKLSQEGTSVLGASDDELIFSSDFNLPKIILSDSTTVVISSIAGGATNTTTIPHGASDIPAFLPYVTLPSNFPTVLSTPGVTGLPTYGLAASGSGQGAIIAVVQARVDSTNIYFDVINTTSSTQTGPYTYIFKYYILQETAG